jgi:fused signal recognition particle receptor
MGLFDRLKQRLNRTREALSDSISGIFRGGRAINKELLQDLENALYTADLGPLASQLVAEIERRHKRGELKDEEGVRASLREQLLGRLDPGGEPQLAPEGPTVFLIVGVNGSGKTTSIAKIAHHYTQQGKKVLLGAGDTFRAAAADQLEIWAQRNGADIVRQQKDGADPAAVAFDSVQAGIARGSDIILIDTAGRLHTQSNLMEELVKVRRVITKVLPDAPHHTLLVLDGTNGQNAIQQARLFTQAVEVSGTVVAKLDGTARGGAVFAIQEDLGLPIHFVGTGEGLADLEIFDPVPFVDAIVGSPAPSQS